MNLKKMIGKNYVVEGDPGYQVRKAKKGQTATVEKIVKNLTG